MLARTQCEVFSLSASLRLSLSFAAPFPPALSFLASLHAWKLPSLQRRHGEIWTPSRPYPAFRVFPPRARETEELAIDLHPGRARGRYGPHSACQVSSSGSSSTRILCRTRTRNLYLFALCQDSSLSLSFHASLCRSRCNSLLFASNVRRVDAFHCHLGFAQNIHYEINTSF
jgi:hypothetical protein